MLEELGVLPPSQDDHAVCLLRMRKEVLTLTDHKIEPFITYIEINKQPASAIRMLQVLRDYVQWLKWQHPITLWDVTRLLFQHTKPFSPILS